MRRLAVSLVLTLTLHPPTEAQNAPGVGAERPLANIRQLTSGGENAEAYFSPDGARLIFQSTRPGYPCEQIFTMNVDGSDVRRVSTGRGRTTCGYFYPGGRTSRRPGIRTGIG